MKFNTIFFESINFKFIKFFLSVYLKIFITFKTLNNNFFLDVIIVSKEVIKCIIINNYNFTFNDNFFACKLTHYIFFRFFKFNF